MLNETLKENVLLLADEYSAYNGTKFQHKRVTNERSRVSG